MQMRLIRPKVSLLQWWYRGKMRYCAKPPRRVSIALMVLLLMLSGRLFVPENARAQVHLSIQAGTTFSTVSGDLRFASLRSGFRDEAENEDVVFSSLTGIAVSGMAAIPIRPEIALQFGVLYTGKGMVYRGEELFYEYNHLRFGYLEFPLKLSYSVAARQRFSPHVSAGPVISILASCKDVEEGDGFRGSVDCPNLLVLSQAVDLGITGGIGVTMATGRFWSASLDVLYTHGLRSTLKTSDLNNRVFSVVAGIAFPLPCKCK